MKNFARSVPKERYRVDKITTVNEEEIDVLTHPNGANSQGYAPMELRESIDTVLAQLSARERQVLTGHFGLKSSDKPQSLEQIGKQLGISKEQVRQIERKAVKKLREMLDPIRSDLLG